MTLGTPSQKWISQKMAVLESISDVVERRINLLSIPYFFALGFFVQWWSKITFGIAGPTTSLDAIVLPISIALILFLGPILLALVIAVKEIKSRI